MIPALIIAVSDIGNWWYVLLVGGVLLAMAIVAIRESNRSGNARNEHEAKYRELSDEEFLRELEIPCDYHRAAVLIRGILADNIGVLATSIHPTQKFSYLGPLAFDGLSLVEVVFYLEKTFGGPIEIEDLFSKSWSVSPLDDLTVRDLVIRFIDKYPRLCEQTVAGRDEHDGTQQAAGR